MFQTRIIHPALFCGNGPSVRKHGKNNTGCLIISATWRCHLKTKRWELTTVCRSKAIFQIQDIRFGRLHRLSICQEREPSCFSWTHKIASRGPGGGGNGADHQRFSATMLRQHSKTKAQSCSRDALLLCFNVAAGRLPRWRAAFSSWKQHKHCKDSQSSVALREKR